MAEDHERIEELLAGYALLALSGEDAAEADRLLVQHVPSCLTCRQALADFQSLGGDLALAADPVPPSDLVLSRLHRAIDDVPLSRRPGRSSFLALAAGVAALVAMGGLSFVMVGRANRAEDRTSTALELLSALHSPGVQPVHVDPAGDTPTTTTGFLEVSAPDVRMLYLAARDCPEPAPGYDYVVWLGVGGVFQPVVRFAPVDGVVLFRLPVDIDRYDEIWITEELRDQVPVTPNTERHSWRGQL